MQPEQIISLVASHFALTPEELTTPCRKKYVYRATHIAMALCVEFSGVPRMKLSRKVFNRRSNSTVTRNIESHGFLLLEDSEYKKHYDQLKQICNAHS